MRNAFEIIKKLMDEPKYLIFSFILGPLFFLPGYYFQIQYEIFNILSGGIINFFEIFIVSIFSLWPLFFILFILGVLMDYENYEKKEESDNSIDITKLSFTTFLTMILGFYTTIFINYKFNCPFTLFLTIFYFVSLIFHYILHFDFNNDNKDIKDISLEIKSSLLKKIILLCIIGITFLIVIYLILL